MGTGTAYAALKRLGVSGRDTLAIFGQGPVGLSATQLATAMGAHVIAVDPSAERRDMARAMGAEVALDPSTGDPVEEIRALSHGEGADATLECSGNSEARVNCARASRPWGRACYVGAHRTATFRPSFVQDLDRLWIQHEHLLGRGSEVAEVTDGVDDNEYECIRPMAGASEKRQRHC